MCSDASIVNNSVNQPPPGPPSAGVPPGSTAGGRVLESTQPAPLLDLARFGAKKQLTRIKGHGVTPFWHNEPASRVTVTFGARRDAGRRTEFFSRPHCPAFGPSL